MPRFRKAIYTLLTLTLAFSLAEGLLRAAGFRYQRVTTYLQFNYPRPGFLKAFFELDPDLLYRIRWTVRQRNVDLTWEPRFQLKIRDSRTFGPKPAGTLRVLALGDSSTYGVNTPEPWPTRLQHELDRRFPPGRFQVLNLGVPGYTAFQGRKVLETRAGRLEPDLVVISFGWNDHLLAMGYEDAHQRVGGAAVVRIRNLLSRSRVYQLLSWCIARARGGAPPGGGNGAPDTRGDGLFAALRRVGPEAFAADLTAMVNTARAHGARALLCTYPTALSLLEDLGMAPPDWLVATHAGAGSVADVVRLQDRYNREVREVARRSGVRLVDLEAAFRKTGKALLFDDPGRDMIHPNDRGYDLITRQVARALQEEVTRR